MRRATPRRSAVISPPSLRRHMAFLSWLRRVRRDVSMRISFHAQKSPSEWTPRKCVWENLGRRERGKSTMFPACLRECACAEGNRNFSFHVRTFFLIVFSCKYGGRGWRRSISPPGSNPRAVPGPRVTDRSRATSEPWGRVQPLSDIFPRDGRTTPAAIIRQFSEPGGNSRSQ